MSKREVKATAPTATQLSSGAWTLDPTTEITCKDCGAKRIIKVQDAFQVVRCVECQKKASKTTRNEKAKARNAAKSEAKRQADLQALIDSLTDEQITAMRTKANEA